VGFAVTFVFEAALAVVYHATPLGDAIAHAYWRVPPELTGPPSGLTAGAHIAAETMAIITPLFLALVAGDIIANESEERTLHMIFSRSVTREAVLAQKMLTCALYTLVLSVFVGVTSLALALLLDGPGRLVLISARESLIGIHAFMPGLERYALAIAMLGPC